MEFPSGKPYAQLLMR